MTEAVRVLLSIGQALAAMRFYHTGHPARLRAINTSFDEILGLLEIDPTPRFTLVEGEAVYHRNLLRELKDWDWATRLAAAGVQRIEFVRGVTLEDYERFLEDVADRLGGGGQWNTVGRQFAPTAIRWGAVGFRDDTGPHETELFGAIRMSLSMEREIAAVEWIHQEVRGSHEVPLLEAEVVVRSLALAIHQENQIVLPLLRLKDFDQYTTTHSCNVAVLATAFAEHLGYEPAHARALGVCGLLHDIGKVWIPRDVLIKPGRLSAAERQIIERHPIEGARILIERERDLDLAAVVSYEHHRWADGGGYPHFHKPRTCHHASQLVQVCDVFDALCTDRPYRPGLPPEVALAEIQAEAGAHFDLELVAAFTRLIQASMLKFMPYDHPIIEPDDSPAAPAEGVAEAEAEADRDGEVEVEVERLDEVGLRPAPLEEVPSGERPEAGASAEDVAAD